VSRTQTMGFLDLLSSAATPVSTMPNPSDASNSPGLVSILQTPFSSQQPQPSYSPSCFPGFAKVYVKIFGVKPIKNLKLGDEILSSCGFSPFLGFLHFEPTKTEKFIEFTFMDNSSKLLVTEDHLLFAYRNESPDLLMNLPARLIQKQRKLSLVTLDECGILKKVSVLGSTYKTFKGVYAPLTESGDLFVNGILCSCYSTPNDIPWIHTHDVSHQVVKWLCVKFKMEPMEIYHRLKWILSS
jgi:Hint module